MKRKKDDTNECEQHQQDQQVGISFQNKFVTWNRLNYKHDNFPTGIQRKSFPKFQETEVYLLEEI